VNRISTSEDRKEGRMLGLSKIVIGVIAVVAGLLILLFPDMLRWIVGIFLIVWGILTMLGKK
jgi:uncharacterized membrane protein HdeD (DUF308 family)